MTGPYVHGYGSRESERLHDQAGALTELLHSGTSYASGTLVLEAGCAVGAQTLPLATRSPAARILSVDIAAESVAVAKRQATAAGFRNVRFAVADIFALPVRRRSLDHIFVCFVLEHLDRPEAALTQLRSLLRPGGTITVVEGDHGSARFHPESSAADAAIACLVTLQRAAGGDALIGRQLYPLLTRAGFSSVTVSPRFVYVDGSQPARGDAITRKTFTAMIEGARERALAAGLTSPTAFDAGIRDLYRAAEADGVFCYTFFKATGVAGH